MKQYWLAVSIVYQRLILVVAVIHAQRPCGRSVMNTLRKHWSSHLEALRCRDKTLQRVEQRVCSKDLLRFSTMQQGFTQILNNVEVQSEYDMKINKINKTKL